MKLATRLRIAGLFVSLAALAGCGGGVPAAVTLPPPEVTVSKPEVRQVTDYFEFPGQAMAIGEVDVRAGDRLPGEGQFQRRPKREEGRSAVRDRPASLPGGVGSRRGDLARLRALMDKAKADLARSERLRPSGAVSEDEYEQHVANLAVHQGLIQSAEAAVRDAELNLEFTKITSPIDGRVSRTRITEGNLVKPGAGDAAVLTTVVTTNPDLRLLQRRRAALLRYEQLAFKTGQELHPNHVKDLKFPGRDRPGQRRRLPARRHPRFRRQQDRPHHGHAPRPRSLRERQGISHARSVRPRADSLRRCRIRRCW